MFTRLSIFVIKQINHSTNTSSQIMIDAIYVCFVWITNIQDVEEIHYLISKETCRVEESPGAFHFVYTDLLCLLGYMKHIKSPKDDLEKNLVMTDCYNICAAGRLRILTSM